MGNLWTQSLVLTASPVLVWYLGEAPNRTAPVGVSTHDDGSGLSQVDGKGFPKSWYPKNGWGGGTTPVSDTT